MFQQSYLKGVDFLQIVVNGGIYRVIFQGKYDSEFNGEHPALAIRTLNENEIYMSREIRGFLAGFKSKYRRCVSLCI